jgi:hypothetical protein
MSDSNDRDLEERTGPLHGIDAIETSDESAQGGLFAGINPRTTGPRDMVGRFRSWLHSKRFWVAGVAIAAGVAIYVLGLPTPDLPTWWDVAVVGGGLATILGYPAGKRVGVLFSNPDYRIIDQLDAKTADQLTIRISMERYQDMTVVDHSGNERTVDYLKRKTWNGEPAVECDRYYPEINTAVGSWQAGATNKELREYESRVNEVKTELEEEANAAIQARVDAEEKARKQSQEVANELLAVYEGVVSPADSELADRLGEIGDRSHDTSEEQLDDLESGLFGDAGTSSNGSSSTNGADGETDETALSERFADGAEELVVSLDPRDSNDDSDGD